MFFVGATLLFIALVFLIALPLKFFITPLLLLLTLQVRLPLAFSAILVLPLTARFLGLPTLLLCLLVVATLILRLVVIATLVVPLIVPLAAFFPTFLTLFPPRILSLVAVAWILRLCEVGKTKPCTDAETQSYQDGSHVFGFHR